MKSSILLTALALATSPLTSQSPFWVQRHSTQTPSARHTGTAMAYDAARTEMVLFAGNETWTWNGASWTQRRPKTSPPARQLHVMAYDAGRKRVVLWGGITPLAKGLNDTWEWDGTNWSQIRTINTPKAPPSATMVYDAARRRVVLHTGLLNETWTFDGRAWTRVQTNAPTSVKSVRAMAYDAARQRVVLYGGVDIFNNFWSNDTWEFDGQAWRLMRSKSSPPVDTLTPIMTYDIRRRRVVLVIAPSRGQRVAGTWEWNGTDWKQTQPTSATPVVPNGRGAIAFDSRRQRVVVFGGSETWEYGWISASYDYIAQRTPYRPWRALKALNTPRIGTTLRVQVPGSSNAKLMANWFVTGFSNPNVQVPALGGWLYAMPEFTALVPATSPQPYAVMLLPIPNAASLLGVTFYQQLGQTDGSGTRFVALSDGGRGTIGY